MDGKSKHPSKGKDELGDLKRKAVDQSKQDQVRGGVLRRGGDDDDDLDELEVQR